MLRFLFLDEGVPVLVVDITGLCSGEVTVLAVVGVDGGVVALGEVSKRPSRCR